MERVFFLITIFFLVFNFSICQKSFALANPWVDCNTDMKCAVSKAGFEFPIRIKNYNARAMKDMIEITFMLDKKKVVTMRKSVKYDGKGDISGVYENYPVNKTLRVKDNVLFRVRGDKDKYYVANYASENGYFSIYCPVGMEYKDVKYLYKLIK